jgi:hypothetical protein
MSDRQDERERCLQALDEIVENLEAIYVLFRCLFDEPSGALLRDNPLEQFFRYTAWTFLTSLVLELAKFGDPLMVKRKGEARKNVTLAQVFDAVALCGADRSRAELHMNAALAQIHSPLFEVVRNRIVAHNDLQVLGSKPNVGHELKLDSVFEAADHVLQFHGIVSAAAGRRSTTADENGPSWTPSSRWAREAQKVFVIVNRGLRAGYSESRADDTRTPPHPLNSTRPQ